MSAGESLIIVKRFSPGISAYGWSQRRPFSLFSYAMR